MPQLTITTDEILSALPYISESPKDGGTLDFIVIRPAEDKRETRESAYLSPAQGISGDRWVTSSWLRLADGGPDPRVQLSIMNARILKLFAADSRPSAFGRRQFDRRPRSKHREHPAWPKTLNWRSRHTNCRDSSYWLRQVLVSLWRRRPAVCEFGSGQGPAIARALCSSDSGRACARGGPSFNDLTIVPLGLVSRYAFSVTNIPC